MATITFKGATVNTSGELPRIGIQAPDFHLVTAELANTTVTDYQGKKVLMNIFPSIDTSVCALSVRTFNKNAAALPDTVVLCISKDLPFAQSRFCGAEGINAVKTLSAFRCDDFEKNYGLRMVDGPLEGLLARAVVVLDETGMVRYTELVPEIAQEPNYEAALAALK